jgi:fused signal recognition particle receptor
LLLPVPLLLLPQTADFGPKTALAIVDGLREELKAGSIKTADDMRAALKRQIVALLEPVNNSSSGKTSELQLQGQPAVLLIVGVNGAGKTTTIGKLAHRLSKEGARVSVVTGSSSSSSSSSSNGSSGSSSLSAEQEGGMREPDDKTAAAAAAAAAGFPE